MISEKMYANHRAQNFLMSEKKRHRDPKVSDDEKGAAIRNMLVNSGSFGKYEILKALKYMWDLCFEEKVRLKETYKRSDTAAGAGNEAKNGR